MLEQLGYRVEDYGTHSSEATDYPHICASVARAVRDAKADVDGMALGQHDRLAGHAAIELEKGDDRTGGIFTRATVRMIKVGTCSITWGFAGTDTRSAATRVMSVVVSR